MKSPQKYGIILHPDAAFKATNGISLENAPWQTVRPPIWLPGMAIRRSPGPLSSESRMSRCRSRRWRGVLWHPIFKHKPLLVCRSPLADTSALLLPGEPVRDEALDRAGAGRAGGIQKAKMFLPGVRLPSHRTTADTPPGPKDMSRSLSLSLAHICPLEWQSFEEYLEKGNKKDRQHYKKSLREAEENGTRPHQTYHLSRM